jgi:hypothetical protein
LSEPHPQREIVLHLRRELRRRRAAAERRRRRRAPAVLGCTIRERAPHLIPSIEEFLRRIGRPGGPADEAAAGRSRSRPAGDAGARAGRRRRRSVCLEQYDAEFLGCWPCSTSTCSICEPPFYYYAPHRIVNRDHARAYPLYDALRRRFGCDMNSI